MTELLRRTLGETIEVRTVLSPRPCVIEIDTNELENALLNLAVNARDAMSDGGRLTIETRSCVTWLAAEPGENSRPDCECVEISVSDTGTGMPIDIQAKVFEPFFTTKEVGKGTGLGLSMVYGFAKQSGGNTSIRSVVGEGTTVSLLFPEVTAGDLPEESDEIVVNPLRGDETVLVVEDNLDVLFYSSNALQELGYRVLQAENASDALKIIASSEDIDLLFSDVVLAGGMSGRQLAEAAISRRPELRVLFTSGYAKNALENLGRIESGMELIGKPFKFTDLAARVNAVLLVPRGWMPVSDR